MGKWKWLVITAAGVLLVGGLAYAGGRYLERNPTAPTADERVSACVDDAMADVDPASDVYAPTMVKVREACEARVG